LYKKSNPGVRGAQVQLQPQHTETIYIEVPQENGLETNYVPIETHVLDEVTSQQVASIVAFENNVAGQSNSEQIHGIDMQTAIVPTVVQEVEDMSQVETVVVVPVDQIQEVIIESQVASSDIELLKHLMELASTNP
jgi:hypothetical protein